MYGRLGECFLCLLFFIVYLPSCQLRPVYALPEVDPATIKVVNVVFMNHLDVGYNGIPQTGFIANVLNTYFDVYFPKAIYTADELRRLGRPERLVYTTHPWLVSLYLDCPTGLGLHCPNQDQIREFEEAVEFGDIVWHSGAFNMQPEAMDASLFNYSVSMANYLDERFNRTRLTTTLSQRDVPGLTRGVIPLLTKAGIRAITVGVNPGSAPPAVPNAFVWKDVESNTSILAMWHPGGYPNNPGPGPYNPGGLSVNDCVLVPGLDHALAFAFRTDNSGPPDYAEVINNYATLKNEFPNAQIVASSFDDFVDQLQRVRNTLPVVASEIGDTWLQGIASDPLKMARFREVARARTECLDQGVCSMNDVRMRNFSRFLVKLPEHTWGLPSVNDDHNWSNQQFRQIINKKVSSFVNATLAWIEQRLYVDHAIAALQNHPLADRIRQRLAAIVPQKPSLNGYVPVSDGHITCPGIVDLTFDKQTASIIGLVDLTPLGNRTAWASQQARLGQLLYDTYNEADFDAMNSKYSYSGGPGYGKPGVSEANPKSARWTAQLTGLWQSKVNGCSVIASLSLPQETIVNYGAPQSIWITINASTTSPVNGRLQMSFDLQWFNKTATRMPESFMFAFAPVKQPQQTHQWLIRKLNSSISPVDVLLNGSQLQHGSWGGVQYQLNDGNKNIKRLFIDSLDAGVTCPSPYTPMPTLPPLTAQPDGMAFNLYNNIWNTNYILWYPMQNLFASSNTTNQWWDDTNSRFRFQLVFLAN